MTELNAIQAAVERAAAFQQYADENGFGRPTHPETAMTDLEQLATRLVKVAADSIAEEERRELGGEDPIGGHGYYAPGIVSAVAVLRELAAAEKTFGVGTLEELADSIEKGAR